METISRQGDAMQQIQAIDEGALFFFYQLHQDMSWLNKPMEYLTYLGDRRVLVPLALIAAVLFFWRQRPRTALVVLAMLGLGYTLSDGVKYLIDRPRPIVAIQLVPRQDTPSFPSAHSLNSMALFVGLALICSRGWSSKIGRGALVLAAFLLALLVGFTRMYLCVHYVSDVLAGFAAGLGLALVANYIDWRWNLKPEAESQPLFRPRQSAEGPKELLPSGPSTDPRVAQPPGSP
jgi:undecaprenyl-diphosphatase